MRRTAPAHPGEGPYTRALSTVAFLAAAVLVLALPLLVDLRALEPFRGPKRELALAAWATLAAVFAVGNRRGAAWRDPWLAAWGGVVAAGAVSALGSTAPLRVLGSVVPLLIAGLGWGAVRQLGEARRARLARFVVWAGVIEAALVLLFLDRDWQPPGFAALDQGSGRYAWLGTLGNPADIAVFLLLPALLAAQRAVEAKRSRALYGGAALLMAATIVGSRTLTAIAALALGAGLIVWAYAPRRLRLRVLAAGAVLLVAVTLLSPLRVRIAKAVSEVRGGGWLWAGSARAAAYSAALRMVARHPLTGVGFGEFESNSFRFLDPDILADRGLILGLQTAFGEAHDEPLQFAAETGALGVAIAAAAAFLALRRRAAAGLERRGATPVAAAAGVILLTQFPLHLAAIAAQWAVVAALLLPPLPPPPVPDRRGARLRLALAGALAAIAVFVAWQRYAARVAVGEGKLLASTLQASRLGESAKVGVARAALANVIPRARWLPGTWEAPLTIGNLAAAAQDAPLALSSFSAALAVAERPEVRFDVGMALIMSGDREAGMADLVRAVELNPVVFRTIQDPDLARDLRRRLDASGYGARHAWMYEHTPAANP